jgi:hypothetical protein
MAVPRVLITNDRLNTRFGAELVTRDLAFGLATLGQAPIIYTPLPGSVADEIRAAGITVLDRLGDIPFSPDIVQGHQHLETIEALMAFPQARGIFVCHARLAGPATPPLTDRIQHYVAVDHNCLERLAQEYAIPSEKVSVIFNSVDTARFRQRLPLPARPQRALVFSNYARDDNYLHTIRTACQQIGLPLDVIGAGVGKLVDRPEEVLPNYDIVFAKARCAIEAMAVGNAVILCDETGLGPMVTAGEVAELRKWNFGMRILQLPITPGRIAAEVARYDSADARQVSDYIRCHSATADSVREYASLYEKIMTTPLPISEDAAAANYRAMVTKIANLEAELYTLRKLYRMEPLTESAAAQISLNNARISVPLREGHVWVQCEVTNKTSQRISSGQPNPIQLSYHWFGADGTIVIVEGSRTPLIPALNPGKSETYELKVAAPRESGEYRLRITLVQEGVRWFDEMPASGAADDIWLSLP